MLLLQTFTTIDTYSPCRILMIIAIPVPILVVYIKPSPHRPASERSKKKKRKRGKKEKEKIKIKRERGEGRGQYTLAITEQRPEPQTPSLFISPHHSLHISPEKKKAFLSRPYKCRCLSQSMKRTGLSFFLLLFLFPHPHYLPSEIPAPFL